MNPYMDINLQEVTKERNFFAFLLTQIYKEN